MNDTTATKPELSKFMLVKAMESVLSTLSSIDAKYRIVLPDGEEFTNIPAPALPARKRKVYLNPPGTLLKIYQPYVQDMKVGAVVQIPIGTIKPSSLQSAVSAYAANTWGKGSAVTHMNKDVVEIMRVK